jgi:hypothetical protein
MRKRSASRRGLLCVLCVVSLAAGGPLRVIDAKSASAPRRFQIVVYDYKQSIDAAASLGTYRADLERQIAAAADHFSINPPTLAVLPEDTGLTALLIGSRGRLARLAARKKEPFSLSLALLGLASLPQVFYYRSKCRGIPWSRALTLALTDTTWRAFGEGLAIVAARHHIWIMANLNAPEITVTRSPDKVKRLGDPAEARRGYAYEGGCEVWNTAFLFGPDARLESDGAADPKHAVFAMRRKVYLVKNEREQSLLTLAMSSETPANARIIATPFARLGVLTSKDAWMTDIVERLEIDGMEVFIQPEAGPWAGTTVSLPSCLATGASPVRQSAWQPDSMMRAVWAMVQGQAETTWGALSDLTGNLGNFYFDGTATLTRRARPGETAAHYLLGRLPEAGIAARQDWAFRDPPSGIPLGDVRARRASLDVGAARLKPRSGDARENGQLAGFVTATIELPPLGPVGRRLRTGPRSIAVAPGRGAQWAPDLAAGPNGVIYAAWTDLRGGFESPYVARSRDGGATWSKPVRAGDGTFHPFDQTGNQYAARVAVAPDGALHFVWADFRHQSWDIYSRTMKDWKTWSTSVRVDHSPCSQEGFPGENLQQDPAVAALRDGTVVAAWSDARGTRADRKIRVARSSAAGAEWISEVVADGGGTQEADQWSPAIAASADGKRIGLAWQDHRTGWNQIFLAVSADGGLTFRNATRLAPSRAEQWQPAVAFAPDGRVGVAWSEGVGGGERRVRVAIVNGVQVTTFFVDAFPPPGVRQARPAIAHTRTGFWVAWQDDRAGDWDVLVARGDGPGSRPARVDDGPPGTHARLPSLAVVGDRRDRLVVAWEDTRDGKEQIRTTVWPAR